MTLTHTGQKTRKAAIIMIAAFLVFLFVAVLEVMTEFEAGHAQVQLS